MAESAATFPYETRLNLLHGPLEVIDVHAIEDARNYKWFNQSLCKVNEGMLLIDLEGRTVELAPGRDSWCLGKSSIAPARRSARRS
jgi:hypothetical protein